MKAWKAFQRRGYHRVWNAPNGDKGGAKARTKPGYKGDDGSAHAARKAHRRAALAHRLALGLGPK